MNPEFVSAVCRNVFGETPAYIDRFSTGLGNYVYHIKIGRADYVFRCGEQPYDQTIRYLTELQALDLPVAQLIAHGQYQGLYYMIVTYLEGRELGDIYPFLSDAEKQTIAQEVILIQDCAARLPFSRTCNWPQWVDDMLARAKMRITANGYFDPGLVDRLRPAASRLRHYFEALTPRVYLDDITTKNLLIQNGHVSGIIDVDWIEYGDRLSFAALTNMSLLNMEYDTKYVQYLLDQMHITQEARQAFQFYTLMFCVDFMGERGTTFVGRTVPVSKEIIERLNCIYDQLWTQFQRENPAVC